MAPETTPDPTDPRDPADPADADVRRLRAMEESLWDESVRFDVTHMDALLHPDFLEFGQSGRTWDRAETLAVEPAEIGVEPPLADLEVDVLSTDVALVTYRVADRFGPGGSTRRSRRSSLWLRTPEGWRLRFHQGTPEPTQD